MSDQEFVIELGADDAEGHGFRRGIVETDDADWLREKLRSDSGSKRVRVMPDDSDDTEGHGSTIAVRAIIADDDDTEGHAISIHFPSRTEADAFRRRLLVTGVLAGTVALGAAGGVGLAALQSDDAGSAGAAQSSVTGSDWTQAERPAGAIQGSAVGSDWTQAERPGALQQSNASDDDGTGELRNVGGPTPR